MARQTVSTVRAASFRRKCLSLAKTCSMGFRSGEYFGRKNSLAPAERISWRAAWPLARPLPPAEVSSETVIDLAFENIDNTCPFNLTHHPALTMPCAIAD